MIKIDEEFFPLNKSLIEVADNQEYYLSKPINANALPLAMALTGALANNEKNFYDYYEAKFTIATNTIDGLRLESICVPLIDNLAQYTYDMLRKYTENRFACLALRMQYCEENETNQFPYTIPTLENNLFL